MRTPNDIVSGSCAASQQVQAHLRMSGSSMRAVRGDGHALLDSLLDSKCLLQSPQTTGLRCGRILGFKSPCLLACCVPAALLPQVSQVVGRGFASLFNSYSGLPSSLEVRPHSCISGFLVYTWGA
jgi:hypothetical protein